MIDVQGFVYWDPGNLNATWHQFNGWEIHPLTAWKLSSSPPPVPFNVSISPSTPQVGGTVSFSATASNGTTASSFNWDFGDAVTASGSSVSHMYVTAQAFTVYVTMTDNLGNTHSTWRTVPVGSWNSAVSCAPALTTLESVMGSVSIQRIPSDPNSTGADYSGGGFQLDGNLPLGSNPSTWPFFRRDIQPPCSVNGTSALVEFHNVTVTNLSKDNCGTTYQNGTSYPNGWKSCDTTFSLVTPGWGDDATCPACYMHRLYSGTDRDWNASNVAPIPAPVEGQRIDVQGFVFWNNDGVTAKWHSYTGWELHPVAAWRTTRQTIVASLSVNPSNPATGQMVTFTGTASGGTTPYSFSWDFGDGTDGTGSLASHVYVSGTYSVHMAVTDSNALVGVASQTVIATNPFAIAISPSSLIVQAGKSNSSTITVTSLNSFSGNVSLSSTASPTSLTVSLSPTTVALPANGSASSLLTVTASATTPPGSYTVAVTGTSETFQQTVQISVTVAGSPTFLLSANPTRLILLAGSKGTTNITATSIGGFSGSVKLAVSGAPSGVKVSLNPTSLTLSPGGSGRSVLTVTTATNNLSGNYTLTVTGTGGGKTGKLVLTLTITSGFTISANPTSLTMLSGSSKSSTISLKSLGLKGNITLSATSSPAGLTTTISPTVLSFTPGQTKSATLTVTSKTAGTYTVTILATSGSISHSITIPVTITDFSITASQTTLTLTRGTSGLAAISLTSLSGFTGTVKLTDAVSPTGVKATLSTASLALPAGGTVSTTLTIASTATTTPGIYTVTVTATSGSLVHKITITITITA